MAKWRGIVNLIGGGDFRFRHDADKLKYGPNSFTSETIHAFCIKGEHGVFVQGDKIKTIEFWRKRWWES